MRTEHATPPLGAPLPPAKLTAQRAKGMLAIRFEFIVRLLRLNTQIITLSIYWEDGREFVKAQSVQPVQHKLVYASNPRVSGLFDDRWLVSYPDDPDTTARVDAELERMVAFIGEHSLNTATA